MGPMVQGTFREVWGTSGEVWETSREPLICLPEGEGAPEQGPQPLRAPGVFLESLEPRLEAPRASIRAP